MVEFKKNLILNISNIDGVEIKSIFEHKLFLKRKIIILFLLFFIFYIICFFFIFIYIPQNVTFIIWFNEIISSSFFVIKIIYAICVIVFLH